MLLCKDIVYIYTARSGFLSSSWHCRLLILSEGGHTVCKIALELLCPGITVSSVGQRFLGLIPGLAKHYPVCLISSCVKATQSFWDT